MTSAFSWQNSVSLCPASFRIPRPNLHVTPGVSCLPTIAFQSPIMKKTPLFWCQFQNVLQVFIEPFNFSFFSITGQGIDLDYCDIKWFALERTEIILSFLRLHPSTAFQTLLLTMMDTPFLLRDSCPQQQIKWVSELNSPIPVHFSLLIPKMSMFTLAITCLTNSNLPYSWI